MDLMLTHGNYVDFWAYVMQARLWEASQVLSCRAKGRTRSWLVVTKAEAGVRLWEESTSWKYPD